MFISILKMGIVGQTFVIFILVLLVAFLVSVGINYSIRTQIERTNPNSKELIAFLGKGEDSLDEIDDIEYDIHKFEKLGGPDIIANQAAIEEVSNRLYHKIDKSHLSDHTRVNFRHRVNQICSNLKQC